MVASWKRMAFLPAFQHRWVCALPEQPQGPAAARGRTRLPHGCWSRVGAAALASASPLPASPPGTLNTVSSNRVAPP